MLHNRCAVITEHHELSGLQRRCVVYRSYVRPSDYRCYRCNRLTGIRYIHDKSVVHYRAVWTFIYLKSSLSTEFQELCIYGVS